MANQIISASGDCSTCVHYDTCTISREWCHSWEPMPKDETDEKAALATAAGETEGGAK